jgi:hypothetical protein
VVEGSWAAVAVGLQSGYGMTLEQTEEHLSS